MATLLGVGARCPGIPRPPPLPEQPRLVRTPLSSAGRPRAAPSYPHHCSHRGVWHHERPAFSLAGGGRFHIMGGVPPIQGSTETSRWPQGSQSSSSASQEQGQLVILFFCSLPSLTGTVSEFDNSHSGKVLKRTSFL